MIDRNLQAAAWTKATILAAFVFATQGVAHAADLPGSVSALAPPPASPPACGNLTEFISTNCPLSWHGITLYGTVDTGVAWQSHGTPFNGAFPSIESVISKNSNHSQWSLAPNGISQSNLGIKGLEKITPGWSFIFDLQAGFNPYSLQLVNGPKSLVMNNGVTLDKQTSNGDSSRAGQFYNSLGYAGISSPTFGTLTVGRQTSLTGDGVVAYDPMGASYNFSVIGYSGVTAGVGDTEASRFTTSLKYRVQIDQFRAAALYQFGGYGAGNASTGAYQFQGGGDFLGGASGKLSLDAIVSHVDNAVSLSGLNAAQSLKYPGTLAATISDNTSEMLLARYAYGPVTFFAGYEHILFQNPSTPQSTFDGIGGYTVVSVNINNTAYTKNRNLNVLWTGAKYAITKNVDLAVAYYGYIQDNYNVTRCSHTSSPKCGGTLDALSFDVVWNVTKKLSIYGGAMFSQANGGLASGYLHHVSVDPAVGLRLQF